MVCQREIHTDWRARLKYVPFLMSVGIGLSINNTRAVFEALFNKQRVRADAEIPHRRRRRRMGRQEVPPVGRGAAARRARRSGLYFTATVFYALANQIYGTVPFLRALPGRLPLHRPAVDRAAVRGRTRAWRGWS